MKILHMADEHIQDKGIEEIERILDFVVDTAMAENPDIIVSAGDIANSQDVKMGSRAASAIVRFVSRLADIAPVVVIRGTESHDGNAPSILSHVRGRWPILVADRPMQVGFFPVGDCFHDLMEGCTRTLDAIITLIPQVTKQFFKTSSGIEGADQEIGQAMTGLFAGFGAMAAEYPGVPHVLVYHGGISGARLPSGHVRTGMDIEVSTDQMIMTGADIFLCGHIHSPQQLGDRCFYSGGLYPVKVDEQECGLWIHELAGKDKRSRYIPTPITRTVRIYHDFTGETQPIIPNCLHPDQMGSAVRYEIKLYQDEADIVDKAQIEKDLLRSGALSVDIRIIRVPRANVRAESVLKAETLADKLTRRAELAGETIDPGVLELAGILEGTATDHLLQMVMGGAI